MDTALKELADQARSGEPEPFQKLVRALKAEGAPAAALVELAKSDAPALRRAALAAGRGRTEPEVVEAVAALARDPDQAVRQDLAEALEHWPGWPVDGVFDKLLDDEADDVRRKAVRAVRNRAAYTGALIGRLSGDRDWRVRQDVAECLATADPRTALPPLLEALAEESDRDVAETCAVCAEKLFTKLGGYPADLPRPRLGLLEEALRRVESYRHGTSPRLAAWLEDRVSHEVDPEKLATFGTVLTVEAETGRLPRSHGVDRTCDAVQTLLLGSAPRAVVLLGDSGAGKTAVVHELAHRLRKQSGGAWHLLRVAPADLLAGTVYLGEWQTKVRNLVQAVKAPKRVILYVPNLEELSETGRSAQSEANVATALAPYIERGEVAIVGESTPDAFRTGLGAVGSLRRLFHAVEVPEAGPEQTRAILQAVRDEAKADVPESVLDRLVELAGFYLAGTAQPGRTVGLLRRVLSASAGRRGPISERDVLGTLSTATGIPVDFLDDGVPLDRAAVRAFFEARVMGQTEAVDAVVDLVTLVKAGLTDPGKPFGVLLFVGPTGVGKTELARALAELLFGDPGRLVRFDMSEFSTFDAHERLIGSGPNKPGLLTAAVRERPFAVLLLDEIEKAHTNVFDLCLQIFDAGRLTDQHGRTADFRRTIIIQTSNIGSAVPRDAPVGFQAGPKKVVSPNLDRDAMLREVHRWFRPEFLNRLDRIVVFRPLAEETAEKIARREVARVLERSGLKRRRLDVDVDPGVLALLLREGYSPAFGARPLKRTVERLVLLPVARAIAAGNVAAGSVLRLVVRSNQVAVEVTPPEAEPTGRCDGAAGVVGPVPSPVQRAEKLAEHLDYLRTEAGPLAARKSELVGRSALANFWDDPALARAVQDEIFRLDGVLAALDEFGRGVEGESEFLRGRRRSERELAACEERLATLESRARHVGFLVRCRDRRDLGDAYLSLTRVATRGESLEGVDKLGRMYHAFARRRGFEVKVLDDRQGGTPPEDALTLLISGAAGAYALVAGETGLHQVSRGKAIGRGGKARPVDRDLVRVEVLPMPAAELADEVRAEVRPLGQEKGRLLRRPKFEVQLLHVSTMTSVRAWIDGTKSEAVDQLRPLLTARVEASRAAAPDTSAQPAFVRRYVLGPSPLVRDLRTGKSTGRLERVLQGHLEVFLSLDVAEFIVPQRRDGDLSPHFALGLLR